MSRPGMHGQGEGLLKSHMQDSLYVQSPFLLFPWHILEQPSRLRRFSVRYQLC